MASFGKAMPGCRVQTEDAVRAPVPPGVSQGLLAWLKAAVPGTAAPGGWGEASPTACCLHLSTGALSHAQEHPPTPSR